MKGNKIFLGIFLLLVVPCVFAENTYRQPVSTTDRNMYFYNYPYWVEVNATTPLYITNVGNTSTNYAEINLSGSVANMTYIASVNQFRTYVTSTDEENTNFTIDIKNASGYTLATASDTLRFRVPFNVEIHFFKGANITGDTEPYSNEFQYAALFYKPSGSGYSYTLTADTNSFYDKIGRLLPYYKPRTQLVRTSKEIYLWARMIDGVATIKAYENGTYDLSTVNTRIYGGLTPMYEFGRPINNGETQFDTSIAGNINVDTESDSSYNVYIDYYAIVKHQLLTNTIKLVGILLVWLLIIVGLGFLCTGWLPTDMRSKAFTGVIIILGLATSPILITVIRYLW